MTELEDTKNNVHWGPILRGAGYIIVLASLIGIVVNITFFIDVLQGEKTFDPKKRINEVIEHTAVQSISLSEAKKAFDEHGAIFIDSRNEKEYDAGHIPGAVSIPWEEFEIDATEYVHRIPVGSPIITYCGGGCESSAELAQALVELEYSEVCILVNGWPLWLEAGYPVE